MAGDPPPKPPDPPDTNKSSSDQSTEKVSHEYQPGVTYNGYKVIIFKKAISPTLPGEILMDEYGKKDITHITKNGANTAIVHCSTASIANSIVKNQKLSEAGYKAYIPIYYVTSCAIVFDIDVKYSISDIISRTETAQFELHSIERVKRRETVSGNPELIDTKRVKLYFHGTDIPEYVYMNFVRLRCTPFVPRVMTCNKCWRIGHSARSCHEKFMRCKRCLNDHLEEVCIADSYKCASCGGNHNSTNSICNERQRQNNIALAMATKNLTRNEASDLFPKVRHNPYAFNQIITSNKYSVLEDNEYDSEYPALQTAGRKPQNDQLVIPTHAKPNLPIAQRRGRSTTRRPFNKSDISMRKRNSSLLSDDEILDDAIQQVAKERKITNGNKQMSKNAQTHVTPHTWRDIQSQPNRLRKNSLPRNLHQQFLSQPPIPNSTQYTPNHLQSQLVNETQNQATEAQNQNTRHTNAHDNTIRKPVHPPNVGMETN